MHPLPRASGGHWVVFPERRRDLRNHVALVQRLAAGQAGDVRVQGKGRIRRSDDLESKRAASFRRRTCSAGTPSSGPTWPQKRVVVAVLDAFAPAPGAIGSHEENLAGTVRFRDEQEGCGQSGFVSVPCVARISVPALARTAGAYHWKPGRVCQTRALFSSVSSELRQQAVHPGLGEDETARRRRAPTVRLGVIPHDRDEIGKSRCSGVSPRFREAPE